MHYHYFTLEQREALARQVLSQFKADPKSALAALREPGYGVCEACEADIPYVQLMEDPLQRLCKGCRK